MTHDGRRLLAQVVNKNRTSLADHRCHIARVSEGRAGRADSRLIDAIDSAGLRGRGGAGFPTAIKMRAVVENRKTPVVVVNGTEGEPVSVKDAVLMRLQPHLVLDGAAIAATAVGANEIHVCIERNNVAAIKSIELALLERAQCEPSSVVVHVHGTPPRYVAGEETALIHWLNGGDAKPTATPPRPFERGVGGRPTLVDNVETLAHVAQIVHNGPSWFRETGTQDEPGTALLTVGGAVAHGAVYEAPIGTPLAHILARAGTPSGVRAVLVGGYFGSWIAGDQLKTAALSNASLRPRGGGLGCGAVMVLPERCCGVVESTRVMRWMAMETAGQCGPCVNGLESIAATMSHIAMGSAQPEALQWLDRWALQVDGRGACKFPDGAMRFLRSALLAFGPDFLAHASGRVCADVEMPKVLPIPNVAPGWR